MNNYFDKLPDEIVDYVYLLAHKEALCSTLGELLDLHSRPTIKRTGKYRGSVLLASQAASGSSLSSVTAHKSGIEYVILAVPSVFRQSQRRIPIFMFILAILARAARENFKDFCVLAAKTRKIFWPAGATLSSRVIS